MPTKEEIEAATDAYLKAIAQRSSPVAYGQISGVVYFDDIEAALEAAEKVRRKGIDSWNKMYSQNSGYIEL